MAKAVDKLKPATAVPERPDVNFKLDDVTLVDENDQQLNWNLFDSLISAQLDLTMTGASTVEFQFEDEEYDFLNDPLLSHWAFTIQDVSVSSARKFSTHKITSATNNVNAGDNSDFEWVLGQNPIDVYVDKIAFRLCQIQTQQNLLTLQFEDRAASKLRDKKGFKSGKRGTITRAGFVAKLCEEAGVEYWIPEIDVVQPIAANTQTQSASDLRSSGGGGLTRFMGLTAKGVKLTQTQVNILNKALQAAVSVRAPMKAQVALVEALITENDIANPNPGTPADEGALSLIQSTAQGLGIDPYDVAAVSNHFLTKGFTGGGGAIDIAQNNPSLPAYSIAQAVQGSGAGAASNGAANYGRYEREATKIVNAYGGGSGSSIPATHPAAYTFTRGPNEDSWDCIQRLASEVNWYAFVREGRLWFVSGNYLFNQIPQLTVRRGEAGVDYVDVDLDMGARDQISEVTVTGRSDTWTALPGMTVMTDKSGPANGKWSVSEVQLDLLDDSNGVTVTLQKPMPARPEPAANLTSSGKGKGNSLLAAAGPFAVQKAYMAAQKLNNQHVPYVWGGGHLPGQLTDNNIGLDCSGSVCWILHRAGMYPGTAADVSGLLATTWGVPGEGKYMTVWANADHVWMEFKLPGLHMQFNTVSASGNPTLYKWGPPGGNPAGFTPRHWPGT